MYLRHARPTLRVLKEDLQSGWDDPQARRNLADEAYEALQPLAELPHPIIRQAAESIARDPDEDNVEGPIRGTAALHLLEIKTSQWRGALWEDPETGVHWLLSAGLAKGNHEDHEDFYKQLERKQDLTALLPLQQDRRLLKEETAARLHLEWELGIQEQVAQALSSICKTGGTATLDIPDLVPGDPLATLTIEVESAEEDYGEAVYVTLSPIPYTEDIWQAALRVLITINPPSQDWDNDGQGNFFILAETGTLEQRAGALKMLVERRELAIPEPGKHAHYTHREHLAEKSVEGKAVRAMCGVFFVPHQDHEKLEHCPGCAERYENMPAI